MKAIVHYENGGPEVLHLVDLEMPTAGEGQVLVRVHAASVNPLDLYLMKGMPPLARILFRSKKPDVSRPGRDVAGIVEALGEGVTRFKNGDAVFGVCEGAFSQYACPAEKKLAPKPAEVSFKDAASTPVAALTALQALRDHGHVQAGQRVLINGAAGGVGSFAVQVAKSFGADVTAVCSTKSVETVREIGADLVIDYTQEDFTKRSERYDIFFDCVSNHTLAASKRVLKPAGIYLMIGGGKKKMGAILARLVSTKFSSLFSKKKGVFFMANINPEDLAFIGDLLASGKMKAVIDSSYRLEDVPNAMRHFAEGHARGKVVIDVAEITA